MDDDSYTFHFHRNYLLRFIEALDLQNITLSYSDRNTSTPRTGTRTTTFYA